MANLIPEKGVHLLIDAFSRVAVPEARLRIVGDGPERARLERAVRGHGLAGSVELAGALTHDELPGVYASADVVVAPSIADAGGDRDGLPNVVLEAMASGLPVVGGDVGALATALGGGAGALVPPGDDVRLADALEALAADAALRARLGRAARARVERDFDLRRCTERLVERLEAAYG